MTNDNHSQVNLDSVLDVAIANEPTTATQDTTMTTELNEITATALGFIELVNTDEKLSMKQIAAKLNEVIERVNDLRTSSASVASDTVRDIKSDRAMTEDDARSILLGDLSSKSTKEAALELGLSYGQIYSSRKGFTFKKVYKEFREFQAKDQDAS